MTEDWTRRAEELVRVLETTGFPIGEPGYSRWVDEAEAIVRASTLDRDCEPLLRLLGVPDHHDAVLFIACRAIDELLERPDCAAELIRLILRGAAHGVSRAEMRAAENAEDMLNVMALDDLAPALVEVVAAEADAAVRDEAVNQLVKNCGFNVIPVLERLGDDERLAPAALACLEKVRAYGILVDPRDPGAAAVIAALVDAYTLAWSQDDVSYARQQLTAVLDQFAGLADADALEPVRVHMRSCLRAYEEADDDAEARAAVDELAAFAAACGKVGAHLAPQQVDDLTRTSHSSRPLALEAELAAACGTVPVDGDAISGDDRVGEEVGPVEAAEMRVESTGLAIEAPLPPDEHVEPATAPPEPPTEPVESPTEPMEPPGMTSMDEAFEEFVRRMERESGD